MDHRKLLPVVLSAAVLAVSTAAILIKLCHDAPPVVIAAGRLTFASIILVPAGAIVARKQNLTFPWHRWKLLLLAAGFLAAHFVLWMASLKHTAVLNSVVIVTTNPIFVGIASWLLFGERMTRRLILAIALAAAGGVVISISSTNTQQGSIQGDLLALGGAAMASCYFLVGRSMRKDLHILAYITPVYTATAIILLLAMFLTGNQPTGYEPTTYLWLALLAVGPQLVGHTGLNWSLRYVTATTVALVILTEPIISSILAWFILDESVSLYQILGGVLILAGVYAAIRNHPASEADDPRL